MVRYRSGPALLLSVFLQPISPSLHEIPILLSSLRDPSHLKRLSTSGFYAKSSMQLGVIRCFKRFSYQLFARDTEYVPGIYHLWFDSPNYLLIYYYITTISSFRSIALLHMAIFPFNIHIIAFVMLV